MRKDLEQACVAIISLYRARYGNEAVIRTVDLRPNDGDTGKWLAECSSASAYGDDISDAVAGLYLFLRKECEKQIAPPSAALALPIPDWIPLATK